MPGSFIEDDLDAFVDEDEFGSVALIEAGPGSVNGVFDNLFVERNNVEGLFPTLMVKTSDEIALALTAGKKLTIDSVEYAIVRPEPDGTGMTLLVLEDYS
jgi:hypothetical protein